MSEEAGESVRRITVKEVAASFGGSAMTGAAKASPGVAVGAGAAEFLSTSVQDLITWGTLVYIVMMILYSAPKVVDAFDYFRRRWKDRGGRAGVRVTIQRDHDVTDKIQELKIRSLEAEIERLKEQLRNGH